MKDLPLIEVQEIEDKPPNWWKLELAKSVNLEGKESSFNSSVKIIDKHDYVPFRVK